MKISDYIKKKQQTPIKRLIEKLEDSARHSRLAHVTTSNKKVIKTTPKKV